MVRTLKSAISLEKDGFQLLSVHQPPSGQLSPQPIVARQNYRNRAVSGGKLWTEPSGSRPISFSLWPIFSEAVDLAEKSPFAVGRRNPHFSRLPIARSWRQHFAER
jgi:hypothetical protein